MLPPAGKLPDMAPPQKPEKNPPAGKPPAAPRISFGGVRATIERWFESRGAIDTRSPTDDEAAQAQARIRLGGVDEMDGWLADPVSTYLLTGTEHRKLRSRQQIYEKWADMLADPIITSALRLHTTAALGGHETRGEMVFIEVAPDAKGNAEAERLVAQLQADLQPIFNRIATTVVFNGIAFGDGYGRIYSEKGVGVVDVYVDELVYPPLVQPYERGNTTVGYTVSTGSRFIERMNIIQMARMRLPRMLYVPQSRVVEKALQVTLRTDDVTALPAVPALASGSFLDGAEVAYDKFTAAWAGLVGQRVQESVQEEIITVQQTGMTRDQRDRLRKALATMFESTNAFIQQAVAKGRSVFGRIRHFIPTSAEKQVVQITPATTGQSGTLTTDDVMMHGRFLAGALGVDLSMLGFADQLSGGLGDGGFFRASAQSAERSRMIRAALSEFFSHIICVHLLMRSGVDYQGQPQPWHINYFSGISALETERAKTRADQMNSAALLVQTLAQLKDLGLDEAAITDLLQTEMGLDEKQAKLYAKALKKAQDEAKQQQQQEGGFGGGEGGGFGGGAVGPVVPADEAGGEPGGEDA